jgi:hypothetical protein
MTELHPKGKYQVELAYEATHQLVDQMSRLRLDMFTWVRENCQPVVPRVTVKIVDLRLYPYATPTFKGSQFGRRSLVHFLTKKEAMLFKLMWGGL